LAWQPANPTKDGACASCTPAHAARTRLPLKPTTPAQPASQPTKSRGVPLCAGRREPSGAKLGVLMTASSRRSVAGDGPRRGGRHRSTRPRSMRACRRQV
jgi:hypothetical protein